jgi:hypothetical protein
LSIKYKKIKTLLNIHENNIKILLLK